MENKITVRYGKRMLWQVRLLLFVPQVRLDAARHELSAAEAEAQRLRIELRAGIALVAGNAANNAAGLADESAYPTLLDHKAKVGMALCLFISVSVSWCLGYAFFFVLLMASFLLWRAAGYGCCCWPGL